MIMIFGMKFRLYPNRQQEKLIWQTFGCTRFVYNQGLAFRIEQYECGNPIGFSETNRLLYKLKHDNEHDWLKDVDAHSLQQALRDLDRAFKNFFEGRAKYPKYKSKHDHNRSYRTQYVNGNIAVVGRYVKLPKLGYVKARVTMPVPDRIHNATIEQTPSGKYFVVLTVEADMLLQPNMGGQTGIDVGIKDFAILSDGTKILNNRYLVKSEKKLRKAQRKLSRMIKGSANWQKQRVRVARIYEYIVNQRTDFLQKLSARLVRENQIICIEDLNVKGMVRNHKLAKNISDVSWSKFFSMLEYKAFVYGCEVIKVPRFYASSQICSDCGFQYEGTKDLSVRQWICPKCGSHHDRDVNAAINILHKGLEIRQQQLQTA